MNTTSLRRAFVPGVAAIALAAGLAACGDNNSSAGGSSSDSTAPTTSASSGGSTGGGGSASGTLSVGGSSAQGSAQTQWITDFQKSNSGVTITYNPVGSGTGRQSFESGAYPFAGSDAFISDPKEYAAAKQVCGADPIEVPDYISPIAIIFNLKGVSKLNLDPKTIGQIFDGKITKWDDPAIKADNPGAKLPSTQIQPVHRSDDSGTTQNFTDYLSKAGGKAGWPHDVDDTWPTTKGLNGDGTSGVVSAVKGADGAIGYADASQAGGFGIVSVKVGSDYVAPSADGAAKDLAASKLDKTATDNQMIYDIERTSTDTSLYPVLLTSYLIACPTYKDAKTANLVKSYLTYVVSPEGQAAGSKAAGSAPLTSELSSKATAIVSKIAAK